MLHDCLSDSENANQCQRLGVGGIHFYNSTQLVIHHLFANFKGDYDTPTNSTARLNSELRKGFFQEANMCDLW